MSLILRNKFIALIFLVIADQVSKLAIAKNLILGQSITILPFFDLTLVFNTGVAFSLFSGGGNLGRWILVILVLAVLLYLAYVLINEDLKEFERVSLLMIFCGGLGNLIDRAFRGHVIDFLHFYYENYSFYVFNFADTYITVGVVIYLIGIIYQYNKRNEDQTS